MYALIQQGTKQFEIEKNKIYQLDRIKGAEGDEVIFDDVLLVVDGENCKIGTPAVKGAKVIGEIVEETKGKKVISFKFKRRKGQRLKKGHRQKYTLIKIKDIQ